MGDNRQSHDEDGELLAIFLEESREHLDGIESDLLEIERAGASVDVAVVNKAFRAVHSVKGAAGFFGLHEVKHLAHAIENVLGRIRAGELAPDGEIISCLLAGADALVGMINAPETMAERDISSELSRLARYDGSAAEAGPEATATAGAAPELAEMSAFEPVAAARPSAASTAAVDALTAELSARPFPAPPTRPPTRRPTRRPEPRPAPAEPAEPEATGFDRAALQAGRAGSVRVGLPLLDALMNLAGELVLARNQLLQGVTAESFKSTEKASQRINQITTELQDAIMSTRMQPLEMVFSKFRRVVRDLARDLGKQVDLVVEGEEVELDRTIIEAIGDPLTHLVRNSVDHGIEKPDVRRASRKPPRGRLRLSAVHKGGQVVIEIEDDGKGIDPQALKRKARALGLMPPEQLDAMSDAALTRLIFLPGFSTAEKVTDVSGRGVGMDVVNSNISKLGGSIDIDSVVGRGTLMSIQLPLTLSILPCLLLSEEGHPFAIPQASLVELQRVRPEELRRRVEWIGESAVLRSRGELLPLVRLSDLLDIQKGDGAPLGSGPSWRLRAAMHHDPATRQRPLNVVIVAAGDFHYGLVVDDLEDSSEVVVKPLGHHLRHCRFYAGATILGDGRPALILDVMIIGQSLRLREADRTSRLVTDTDLHGNAQTLLIVENARDDHFAIPLGVVVRIEKIGADQITVVAGKRTLRHRGGSLLLFAIEDVVPVAPRTPTERPYVIIFRIAGREAGLIVSRLIDTVDTDAAVDDQAHGQPGVFGSLVHDDRLLLLLDAQGIAAHAMPQLTARRTEEAPAAATAKRRILVVDDSSFFRHTIASFVEDLGHETVRAEDGQHGLEVLAEHPDVALVLTDIEMPRLDGFEMTRAIRRDPRFGRLPIIAITSLTGEAAERRGRDAGVDEYLVKLDRDLVVERTLDYLARGRGAAPAQLSAAGAKR